MSTTASLATVQGCDQEWKEAWRLTREVSLRVDAAERNAIITAKYAELFLRKPSLWWAGLAAFASKQVGCWMADFSGPPFGPLVASVLGEGNKIVFEDIYPVLLLYSWHDMADRSTFIACLAKHGVSDELLDACALLFRGELELAARAMLRREQRDILQETVYDRTIPRIALALNDAVPLRRISIVFSAHCVATNGVFEEICDDVEFYDFKKRWPFAKRCLRRFAALVMDDQKTISSNLEWLKDRPGDIE